MGHHREHGDPRRRERRGSRGSLRWPGEGSCHPLVDLALVDGVRGGREHLREELRVVLDVRARGFRGRRSGSGQALRLAGDEHAEPAGAPRRERRRTLAPEPADQAARPLYAIASSVGALPTRGKAAQ